MKEKIKDIRSSYKQNKSSYMSFHGCFLLTWEEKGGGGQRAREEGPARPVTPQFGQVRG